MTDEPMEENAYSLVMPFTACASNGGPFDDDAFVAGYQAGSLNKTLEILAVTGASEYSVTVNAALVAQLDLIAMRHGFQLKPDLCEDAEGWAFAKFRRASDVTE